MKQTRKGRNWHFGMKLHIGTNKRGIVHTVRATHAAVADVTQLPELLHGEGEVFGDQQPRAQNSGHLRAPMLICYIAYDADTGTVYR
jgi:IS5 family transposase